MARLCGPRLSRVLFLLLTCMFLVELRGFEILVSNGVLAAQGMFPTDPTYLWVLLVTCGYVLGRGRGPHPTPVNPPASLPRYEAKKRRPGGFMLRSRRGANGTGYAPVEMQGVEPCSTLLRLAGFQRVETIPIPELLFTVPVSDPRRVTPITPQIPYMLAVLLPPEAAPVPTHYEAPR